MSWPILVLSVCLSLALLGLVWSLLVWSDLVSLGMVWYCLLVWSSLAWYVLGRSNLVLAGIALFGGTLLRSDPVLSVLACPGPVWYFLAWSVLVQSGRVWPGMVTAWSVFVWSGQV